MGQNASKAVWAQGRIDAHMMDPDALTIVQDDPKHPLYDGLGKDGQGIAEDMILNVMAHGILQPILARKAGEKDGRPVIEVIAGRDRVRAARLANARLKKQGLVQIRVPVILKRGDDSKLFGMMLSENIHRKELSPLYKATQMQRYLDFGASEKDVMRDLKISSGTVRNYKALLELSTPVKKAVDSFQISAEAAIELSKLPHSDQPKALEEMVKSGATHGMKGKEAAQNAGKGKPAKPNTTARMLSRKKLELLQKALKAKDNATCTTVSNVLAVVLGNLGKLKDLPEAVQQTIKETIS